MNSCILLLLIYDDYLKNLIYAKIEGSELNEVIQIHDKFYIESTETCTHNNIPK